MRPSLTSTITVLGAALVMTAASAPSAGAEPIRLAFDTPAPRPQPLVLTASLAAADDAAPAPAPAATSETTRMHGTTVFGLPRNIGPVDRVARAVIGSALLGIGTWGLATSGHMSTAVSGALVGVSAIPFATAATGYCPIYQVVGVDYTF